MGSIANPASSLRAIQDIIKENPHQDWDAVQASRPDYDPSSPWTSTKTPNPEWKAGDGASDTEWKRKTMLHVDPKGRDRKLQLLSCKNP